MAWPSKMSRRRPVTRLRDLITFAALPTYLVAVCVSKSLSLLAYVRFN